MHIMQMNCNMSTPMNCNMSMGPMKMQMHFYFGAHNVTVLFKDWDINSIGTLIGSFVAIFVMALLYEGLKVLREVIQQNKGRFCVRRIASTIRYQKIDFQTDLAAPSYGTIQKKTPQTPVVISFGVHIVQTLLHMVQITISYFLMLIVMTYNVWLFIAVILGAGAGYFLFAKFRGPGTRSVQDENEHCH